MEKTLEPIYTTIRVPWLPAIVEIVDGKLVTTTRYASMPVVGGIVIALDYGFVNGAN
jgi:hypothetical protein